MHVYKYNVNTKYIVHICFVVLVLKYSNVTFLVLPELIEMWSVRLSLLS